MAVYDAKYDLNKDGIIDNADFEIFKSFYLQVVADNPEAAVADFNGDGQVTGLDYSLLLAHYGAIKPETSNWVWILGVIVVLALIARPEKPKRRR